MYDHVPLAGLLTLVADGGPPAAFTDDWAAYTLELPTGWTVVPGKLTDEAKAPSHVTLGVGTLVSSLEAFIAERDPGWTLHARTPLAGSPGEKLVVEQDVRGRQVRLVLAFIPHGPNVLTLRGRDEAAFERAFAALRLLPVPPAEGPGTLVSPDGAFDYPAGWTRDGRFSLRGMRGDPASPVSSGHRHAMVMISVADGDIARDLEGLKAFLKESPAHGRVVSAGDGLLGSAPAHRVVTTAFGDDTTVIRLIAGHQGRVLELSLRVDAAPERVPAELAAELEAMAASWRWAR
ncbi:MAG: hypothetical protein JWM80_5546 [Cyanobacteria bacterium RYN_339]|nr:hypothetical protein [Cyanobacteria bacterium RYN_339]